MKTRYHRCKSPAPGNYFAQGWAAPNGGPYWLLCPVCYAALQSVRTKVAAFQAKLMRQFTGSASNPKADPAAVVGGSASSALMGAKPSTGEKQ